MKNLLLTIALLVSFNVGAVTIHQTTNSVLDSTFLDYGQYHTQVGAGLNGNGLDWLEFGSLVENPITFGYSINNAVGTYGSQGWRLATGAEVYALFDMFFAPEFNNEAVGGILSFDNNHALVQSRNSWLFGFGTDAVPTEGGIITTKKSTISTVGLFEDGGIVRTLGLTLNTNPLITNLYGPGFTGAVKDRDYAGSNMGVFMVRNTVVPIPAAIWLFGTGLIALLGIARRRA